MEKISRGGRTVAGFSLGASGEMSYEDAVNAIAPAAELEQVDVYGHASGADLTTDQLSAPMASVSQFLSTCGAPDDMKVTVRVAIKNGRASGVTVDTDPTNSRIASCVSRQVRGLRWPSSPRLDTLTTQY